jgi:pimeloyl-ACP methyl ester carboxylesterase
MAWPQATDYAAAVQNPAVSFSDADLRQGQVVGDLLGLPRPHSGNFADVYQIQGPGGQAWAVKCFTREVHNLQGRYQAISEHLAQHPRAFMVDFHYQEQGICVRGQWFPIVKMRWVEGFRLNEFVAEQLDRPAVLDRLAHLIVKLALELGEAHMAHGDLQHGNVLLVPGSKTNSLSLCLIDYDGMYVPALAQQPSGEVGHPHYQHPQRLAEGFYHPDMDRFSLLILYTALRALCVAGKELWQRYDNGENLLFREEDFRRPADSKLLAELWQLGHAEVQALIGQLVVANRQPVAQTPLLPGEQVQPLTASQEEEVRTLLRLPSRPVVVEALPPGSSPVPPRRRPWGWAALGEVLLTRARTVGSVAASVVLFGFLLTWLLARPATDGSSGPGGSLPGATGPALQEVKDITMEGGQPCQVPITVLRNGRSTATLQVKVEGLPAQVSARPVTLPPFRDSGCVELTAPLRAEVAPQPVTLALYCEGDRVSQQQVTLTVLRHPLPRLLPVPPVRLKAGLAQTVLYQVERQGNRDRLQIKMEGLPPRTSHNPVQFDADQPEPPLAVTAAADAPVLAGATARLTLWIGNELIASQPVSVAVEKGLGPPRLVAPAGVSLTPGKRERVEVTVQRNGFTGAIEVGCAELPQGVKCLPATMAVGEDSAMLELQAGDQAAAGMQRFVLVGRAGDLPLDPVEVLVTIKKPAETVPLVRRLPLPQRVEFATGDGVKLVGQFYPSTKDRNSRAVLLIPPIGSATGERAWQDLAQALQGKGYAVLSFDFRGHGSSTEVLPEFLSYAHNRLVRTVRLNVLQQPKLLARDFPPAYWPHLVNDIAAARSLLDHKNDLGELNSRYLVVIAAGRGAALASLWLAAEWQRYEAPGFGVLAGGKSDAEGKAIAAAVWLSLDPSRLGRAAFPVDTWLANVGRSHRTPMLFLAGQEDKDRAGRAQALAERARGSRLTVSKVIANTALADLALLRPELPTQEEILKFLAAVEELNPPGECQQIGYQAKTYQWQFPIGLPATAKFGGLETLAPLPVERMGVR